MAFSTISSHTIHKTLFSLRVAQTQTGVTAQVKVAVRDVTTFASTPSRPLTSLATPRPTAVSSLRAILNNNPLQTPRPNRISNRPNPTPIRTKTTMSTDNTMSTSGTTLPVWTHALPLSSIPRFSSLDTSVTDTEICIIGAGIAGISTAYELTRRGHTVTLLEAREVLSGETGRTSAHLTNDLDDGYLEIGKVHGEGAARIVSESHGWARERVGEVVKELGVECEYRRVNAYDVSQFGVGEEGYDKEMEDLKKEAAMQGRLGMATVWDGDLRVRGWEGKVRQKGGMVVRNQVAFHPTRYLVGVLAWLEKQPNFKCFTHTRVVGVEEKGVEVLGMGHKSVVVTTEAGHTVRAEYAVEATCVPLQKLSIIAEMEFFRTYCIAVRVPKGSVEDCLLYDNADMYKYVRLTACDDKDDYLVVGGCDHKVGQEETTPRFGELETWTRERFPQAGTVDYRWSGQIFEPVDFLGFVGKNQGCDRIFIITGDSGDGLTNGVLAGRLITDEIEGVDNPWAKVYSPKRIGSILKNLPSLVAHDLQINAQYKRLVQSDITDIEDLVPGSGGVLNPVSTYPRASG